MARGNTGRALPIDFPIGPIGCVCYVRAPADLLRRDAETDRAAHAGAAEAAIAVRVLGEILLMIILGVVERRRIEDLGRDPVVHAVPLELLLEHRARGLGRLLLLGREGIDAGAILRADIVALSHALSRVVRFPEYLEQRRVRRLLR